MSASDIEKRPLVMNDVCDRSFSKLLSHVRTFSDSRINAELSAISRFLAGYGLKFEQESIATNVCDDDHRTLVALQLGRNLRKLFDIVTKVTNADAWIVDGVPYPRTYICVLLFVTVFRLLRYMLQFVYTHKTFMDVIEQRAVDIVQKYGIDPCLMLSMENNPTDEDVLRLIGDEYV